MTPNRRDMIVEPVLELRVIAGDLCGARAVVDASQPVSVGLAPECDVVLRGADLPEGCLWTFRARASGGVWVRVTHGPLQAGEGELPRHEDVAWPFYAPLRMGSTVLAIGRREAPDWHAIDMAGEHAAARPVTPEFFGDEAADPPHARGWPRWTAVFGGAAVALSMALWAFSLAAQPEAPSQQRSARDLEAQLHRAGFAKLSVRIDEQGSTQSLQVSGELDTLAQRSRVEQLLARQPAPIRLAIRVDEALTNAVQDVFRAHNVDASVQTSGGGQVIVATRSGDAARLDAARTAALRDIRDLDALEVRDTPPPIAPVASPSIDDPGKRVTAIVPGDVAYVVTADGTRYFEGAVLLTGHRIAAIRAREVLLEKEGTTSPLRF